MRAGLVDQNSLRFADADRRPLEQHLRDYFEHCAQQEQAARHIICKRTHLQRFVESCETERLSGLTADALQRHLAELRAGGRAARTVNASRQAIVAFMNWCVKRGRIRQNQLVSVPKLDEQRDRRRQRRSLTPAELTRLLTVARERDEAASGRWSSRELAYAMAARTGLRRSELRALEWRDLDFDAGVMTVRSEISKNKRSDRLPLHPEIIELLKRRRPADIKPREPVFRTLPTIRTVYADFERAGIQQADAEGRVVDLHALRTTLATELARQGVAPQVAQKIMRHADYRTTLAHYTALGLEDSAAALTALPSLKTEAAEEVSEARPRYSRFDSTRQQNRQQSGHDSMPADASRCDSNIESSTTRTRAKSPKNNTFCGTMPRRAKGSEKAADEIRTHDIQLGKVGEVRGGSDPWSVDLRRKLWS